MYWLASLMGLSTVFIIVLGLYLELNRGAAKKLPPRRLRSALGAQLALFAAALASTLLLGIHDALAQTPASAPGGAVTLGFGLAILGAGLPMAVAAIGAGIALGPVGAAAMAVLAEKPEMFGRTLVYMGLAEGIAIYGLVVSILLLGRI